MAQELLTTFADELAGVTLVPSDISGRFWVGIGEETIWDRKTEGGFPDIKLLKQKVRDTAAPGKSLGHSDKPI